ncbi:MAG: RNA polymerase sigma factor region1.1 domain-containing protein, partial [Gaiellales bacterium]
MAEAVTHAALGVLLRQGEEQGCVNLSEFNEITRSEDLEDEEVEAFYEELQRRGIDLTDDCTRAGASEGTYVNGDLAVATTDALQLFLNEIGRHPL